MLYSPKRRSELIAAFWEADYYFKEEETMTKVCDLCGWEYNEEEGCPEAGIEPGTKWEDVPEDFVCPVCGAGKDEFSDAD